MKKIQWDEGLSIGDPDLDGEHRQLIALLNRLIDLIDEDPDAEQVHRVLDELELLAAAHSRNEERLSFSASEDFKEEQRREHNDFRAAIIEARGQLRPDDLGGSLIDVTESLVKLLINHIIDQDLDLAALLDEQEAKSHSLAEYLVHRFQKISLVRGLEMLVIISLLPMLIFAGMIMYQSWQGASEAGDVVRLAAFSRRIGNLAHELQKERGLSAGFLTSEDRAFKTALKLQRKNSNRELAQFKANIEGQKLEGRLGRIGDRAARVVVRMEALEGYRDKVDRRLVTPQESFDRFTGLITELTALTNQIAIHSRRQGGSELFQANAILIQFAEMGGRERAVVSAAFGRGYFTRPEYRQLVSLTSEQDTLARQFRSFLSEPQWLRWREHYSVEAVVAYKRLSDYALELGSGDGKVSVDSFTWFKVATQRINLINTFQQQLISQLQDEMRRKRSLSTAIFMTTVFGGGAMVFLIGFVALQLARSIRLPILSLTEGMRSLTADDKSFRIPFANRKDELGDMVKAYETFRRKLIRADMLTLGEQLGPLAINRHALALKRSAAEGQEYKRLASIDSLTGVINRREFMKRAKMEVARLLRHQGDLTVLLLDVDYFKQVNDTYGHPAGDRVLKFVSQSIVSALREEDILGRIGGEEFAALLPATDQTSAGATAERIRTAIENLRIQVGEDEIKVTISIGISQLVPGENAIEPAMERADRALYRAKDQGRNQVCVLSGIESMAG
ncbi:diguanylate cyclase [Sedimenticola sp.]|uniref:diguanylate cyclase n=1 Tax=Sedimenticola sp. TaxID=1940285 RepID=UPI003D12E733